MTRGALDPVLSLTQRLNVSVEAVAALAALLRIEGEELPADPRVTPLLREVAACLDVDLSELAPQQKQVVAATVRAFFRQAADLMEDPGRAPGWSVEDPLILQTLGRTSGLIAPLIKQVSVQCAGLAEALERPGARFLDLGVGVAWLSIEMAREFPALEVVGLDIWQPALELARRNIEEAGLADRVSVREQDATTVDEPDGYDLVFVPGPFLPADLVPAILAASARSLRPGGWVAFTLYAGPPDPLAALLTDLRVVRSGGRPWTTDEAGRALLDAGLTGVVVPERTWPAPAVFAFGRKPL